MYVASDGGGSTDALTQLVPVFLASVEQSSRLQAGAVLNSTIWLPSGIVYQRKVDKFVFSVLLSVTANVGALDGDIDCMFRLMTPLIQ